MPLQLVAAAVAVALAVLAALVVAVLLLEKVVTDQALYSLPPL